MSYKSWTQLALISPNITGKVFLLHKNITLFILSRHFHYNIAIHCASIDLCSALSLFQLAL